MSMYGRMTNNYLLIIIHITRASQSVAFIQKQLQLIIIYQC